MLQHLLRKPSSPSLPLIGNAWFFANWNGNEGFVIVPHRRVCVECFFFFLNWYPKKTFFAYFSCECSHACFGGCLAATFAFPSLTHIISPHGHLRQWGWGVEVGGGDMNLLHLWIGFRGNLNRSWLLDSHSPVCLMETNVSLMAAVVFFWTWSRFKSGVVAEQLTSGAATSKKKKKRHHWLIFACLHHLTCNACMWFFFSLQWWGSQAAQREPHAVRPHR